MFKHGEKALRNSPGVLRREERKARWWKDNLLLYSLENPLLWGSFGNIVHLLLRSTIIFTVSEKERKCAFKMFYLVLVMECRNMFCVHGPFKISIRNKKGLQSDVTEKPSHKEHLISRNKLVLSNTPTLAWIISMFWWNHFKDHFFSRVYSHVVHMIKLCFLMSCCLHIIVNGGKQDDVSLQKFRNSIYINLIFLLRFKCQISASYMWPWTWVKKI